MKNLELEMIRYNPMRIRRAPPSLLTFKLLEGESLAEIPFEVLTSNRKVKLMPRERDMRFRIP